MRNVWLGLSVLPYLAAVGADAWLHAPNLCCASNDNVAA